MLSIASVTARSGYFQFASSEPDKRLDCFSNAELSARGERSADGEGMVSARPRRPQVSSLRSMLMAKLRHIALSVPDPEAAAKFFEQAFGMTRAGNAMRGIYMTDGIMNVALLNFGDEPIAGFEDKKGYCGLLHFGMWVDSLEDTDAKVKAAGGSYLTGRKETNPNVYYEVKYTTPEGIVFDITESGWKGAVKEVSPTPRAA
jgi:lactoylglutathione lyase